MEAMTALPGLGELPVPGPQLGRVVSPVMVGRVRRAVQRRVTPAGKLVLEGDAAALDEPAAALLGEHALAFR